MRKFKCDYDFEGDMVYFYDGNEKTKGSIDFGNFVIDIGVNGNFVALEILDKSSLFLSELTKTSISKDYLKELKEVECSFDVKDGRLLITVIFPAGKENNEVPALLEINNFNIPVTA